MPSYRLHKASGRAVIQYRPMFGRNPYYLPGKHGSEESHNEYLRLCGLIHEQIKGNGRKVDPKRKAAGEDTLVVLMARFMDWAEGHYGSTSGELGHFRKVINLAADQCGKTKAKLFGPILLKRVRQAMIDRDWSRTHINHQINRLRRIFRWGVENEMVDASTLANLREVAGLRKGKCNAKEPTPRRAVEWRHVEAVLPYVSPMIAAMIHVQWLTGMRSDELTGMRKGEIDRRGEVWIYMPGKHKTEWRGKRKLICLGPKVQRLIEHYLKGAGDAAYLFPPATAVQQQNQIRANNRKTPVVPSQRSRKPRSRKTSPRYNARSYNRAIRYGFEKLERSNKSSVVRWHPHQLRHSRATLTREQYGIEGAQAQLGNTLEATEIYAEKSVALSLRIALETG